MAEFFALQRQWAWPHTGLYHRPNAGVPRSIRHHAGSSNWSVVC